LPYKDPEKRKRYDRERKRKIRAEEREKKIQEQIALGNLNYGIKTEELSFEDWKEAQKSEGKTAKFQDFLDSKGQITPIKEEHFEDLDSVPIMNQDCEVFRKMKLGVIRRNPFFYANHVTCQYCSIWLRIFNKEYGSVIGVDLWGSKS